MTDFKISGSHNLRPRYSETDQMGVVYYGNYATYFEVGRVELLRKIGMTYAEMEKAGTMLPVVHMSIDYKKGAVYDEDIILHTTIEELPTRKISFYHHLQNAAGETLVKGKVVLVFVDTKTFKPKYCPESLQELLIRANEL